MTIERRAITSRAEWLQLRLDYLTASDVAAAAGVDPYKSRARLYAEKADHAPGVETTSAMRRGQLFEVAAIEYMKEEHPGWLITRPAVFVADPETRLACTPDALVTDPAVSGTINCQIKTISRPAFDRWPVDAAGQIHPPLGYVLQVTCENLLLDAKRGLLCVLVVSAYDAGLSLFDVPRHPAAEKKIVEIAASFWTDVATARRPAPDFSRDADLIADMFPRPEPEKAVDLSSDNRLAEILPLRETLKDTIDGARKELDGLDAEVKYKLGDAEVAELPGWRLTWRLEHRNAYQVEASDRRVLRVKQIEEKEKAA